MPRVKWRQDLHKASWCRPPFVPVANSHLIYQTLWSLRCGRALWISWGLSGSSQLHHKHVQNFIHTLSWRCSKAVWFWGHFTFILKIHFLLMFSSSPCHSWEDQHIREKRYSQKNHPLHPAGDVKVSQWFHLKNSYWNPSAFPFPQEKSSNLMNKRWCVRPMSQGLDIVPTQ